MCNPQSSDFGVGTKKLDLSLQQICCGRGFDVISSNSNSNKFDIVVINIDVIETRACMQRPIRSVHAPPNCHLHSQEGSASFTGQPRCLVKATESDLSGTLGTDAFILRWLLLNISSNLFVLLLIAK